LSLFGVIWRQLKALFHWTFHGYCCENFWHDMMSYKILLHLKELKKMLFNRDSHDCDSDEFYTKILDRMIDGFEALVRDDVHLKPAPADYVPNELDKMFYPDGKYEILDNEAEDASNKYNKETLALFIEYYYRLWD